jgi:secondary thiamine-phosphate synthase enzyme
MMLLYLELKSKMRNEMMDITSSINELVASAGSTRGICHLFVLHTTAGLTINEGADPDVRQDLIGYLNRLVPADAGFKHSEGNSDAHIKSTLVGTSLTIPMENGRLLLGTWQAVYFCEFDGPRQRRVAVKLSP